MAFKNTHINIDLNGKEEVYAIVNAKQWDTGRELIVKIYDDGLEMKLDDVEQIDFKELKGDGKKVHETISSLNKRENIDYENNTIRIELTEQMLAAEGLNKCEILIFKRGEHVKTGTFCINVIATVHNDEGLESLPQYGTFENALQTLLGYSAIDLPFDNENVKHIGITATNTQAFLEQITQLYSETKAAETLLFQDVDSGKKLIADAISKKNVATLSTDTFATMANNIYNINTGGKPNIYLQMEEPYYKEGIWIKTEDSFNFTLNFIDNFYEEGSWIDAEKNGFTTFPENKYIDTCEADGNIYILTINSFYVLNSENKEYTKLRNPYWIWKTDTYELCASMAYDEKRKCIYVSIHSGGKHYFEVYDITSGFWYKLNEKENVSQLQEKHCIAVDGDYIHHVAMSTTYSPGFDDNVYYGITDTVYNIEESTWEDGWSESILNCDKIDSMQVYKEKIYVIYHGLSGVSGGASGIIEEYNTEDNTRKDITGEIGVEAIGGNEIIIKDGYMFLFCKFNYNTKAEGIKRKIYKINLETYEKVEIGNLPGDKITKEYKISMTEEKIIILIGEPGKQGIYVYSFTGQTFGEEEVIILKTDEIEGKYKVELCTIGITKKGQYIKNLTGIENIGYYLNGKLHWNDKPTFWGNGTEWIHMKN